MKFYIREGFYKNISDEKLNFINKNLNQFYKEIVDNIENIRNISKGFWIKKIKGVSNVYEFRINSGDRIFFSIDRRGAEEERITFILYSVHDRGVSKAKKINKDFIENYFIVKNNVEDEEIIEEDKKEIFKNYNDVISYEYKEDEFFKKENSRKFYYLNDEQYNALKDRLPLFIAGSAGSGKSTITLRKILNLEENQESYGAKKILYITRNPLLKEEIEKQYELFRDKSKEKIIEFFTPKEYFKKKHKVDTRNIINFEKFKNFLTETTYNKNKYKIEGLNIYFEIFGVLKGLMCKGDADNWERNVRFSSMSVEEYLNLNSKYSVLQEEEKKYIYELLNKYEVWKIKNNFIDIIDLSLKYIEENAKYDYVIVDEIQDFYEVEIFFLFELLKNKNNFLVAGDIHQMINFNSFSFGRLKNLYYKQNIEFSEKILSKNYRNSKGIVKLANILTTLRKEYIGNLGIEDYRENFILEDGAINISEVDYSFLKKMQNVNSAIIVSDEEEANKLKELNFDRIFTVEEIKGLEYENILCYNLLSKNLWAWEKILSKKVKQDQRYRKYFNIFYVGITRARKNLIIMEEQIEGSILLDKLKNLLEIENEEFVKVNSDKFIEKENISSKKEWLEEGIKLYKLEKLREAEVAFAKGGDPTWIIRKNIEEDIENGDYRIALNKIKENELTSYNYYFHKKIIDIAIERKEYLKGLSFVVEEFNIGYKYKEIKTEIEKNILENSYSTKELNKLVSIFLKKAEYKVVGEIYYKIKNYELAINFYKKVNYIEGIKKSRKIIFENKFRDVEDLENKLKMIDEAMGDGEINTFDKNRLTPIFKIIKYKNLEVVEMMIVLGADIFVENRERENVLFECARNFDVKSFKFFISKGVSCKKLNKSGDSIGDVINKLKINDDKLLRKSKILLSIFKKLYYDIKK